MPIHTISAHIIIHASPEKVWEVLTQPDYIHQWDDVPESYAGGQLALGSVLEWEGYSRLTVTTCQPCQELALKMYLPRVPLDPLAYDVQYRYSLTDKQDHTVLHIEVGDFAPLPNAESYLDATQEWIKTAGMKIKELAEN